MSAVKIIKERKQVLSIFVQPQDMSAVKIIKESKHVLSILCNHRTCILLRKTLPQQQGFSSTLHLPYWQVQDERAASMVACPAQRSTRSIGHPAVAWSVHRACVVQRGLWDRVQTLAYSQKMTRVVAPRRLMGRLTWWNGWTQRRGCHPTVPLASAPWWGGPHLGQSDWTGGRICVDLSGPWVEDPRVPLAAPETSKKESMYFSSLVVSWNDNDLNVTVWTFHD